MTSIYWIDASVGGRLAIMARPRAGDWLDTEIAEWKEAGVEVIVSLLEIAEVNDLGLQEEAPLCRSIGIELISFPIPDRGVPESNRRAAELAGNISAHLCAGRIVAIHCRAGIGRSSVVAACVLIRGGMDADEALSLIAAARGVNVPDTDEQREWLRSFAAHMAENVPGSPRSDAMPYDHRS
jgi:protein-tyrosine phosphatase